MREIKLDGSSLSLTDLRSFLSGESRVSASESALNRVEETAAFCQRIAGSDAVYYGINTGFGVLAKQRISSDSLAALQRNLLRSHAAGVGDELPPNIVRLMIVLRVNSLLKGYSGVSVEVVERMFAMLDGDIIPCVPAYGSVGASGDLAPLAHMALAIIGEGDVRVSGRRMDAASALRDAGLNAITLGPKEGLALINGTQLMTAYGVREALRIRRLLEVSIVAAAMSIEVYGATDRMFDPRIHALKPHPGQIEVAAAFRRVLQDSDIIRSHRDCDRVQDPYSFRCAPQVLGAVLDTLSWAEVWLEREINAVTDNPILFPDEGDVVSGGNFHGQHMAFALDALGVACSEIGSIAERRIDKLLDNDTTVLPECLIHDAGLNSGLMVAQYLAAALVSENKINAHPASVDTIPTSAGFEDHVSMGSIGALKLARIVDNVRRIISVELLCAAQALDFYRPRQASQVSEAAYARIRGRVPYIAEDCIVSELINRIEEMLVDDSLLDDVERALGGPVLRK